jgi:Zn-dependent protease with chaperone function
MQLPVFSISIWFADSLRSTVIQIRIVSKTRVARPLLTSLQGTRTMLPASFQSQRLHRPWWTTAITMVLCPLLVLYTVVWLVVVVTQPIGSVFNVIPIFFAIVAELGPGPLMVTSFIGLCGLGWGSRYVTSATNTLTHALGVTELPATHALTKRVHRLADQLQLPKPKVAMMTEANAYAIGKSPTDAAVVIGLPLIQSLSSEELDAVIGHELGHIVSGDMRRMQMAEGYQTMLGSMFSTFVTILIRAIAKTRSGAMLGQALGQLGRITLFIGSELIVKRLSRSREFVADAIGAALTSPAAMQSALMKIHGVAPTKTKIDRRYASLMFYSGASGSLMATHPTLQRRIQALESGDVLSQVMRKGTGETTSLVYARQAQAKAATLTAATLAAIQCIPVRSAGTAAMEFLDKNLLLGSILALIGSMVVGIMVL